MRPIFYVQHETFKIQSKQVGEERIINVWTPTDYKNNTDSLPVMYMADGGLKEDFPHIANTLAELVNQKKIKPLILVGVQGISETESGSTQNSVYNNSGL